MNETQNVETKEKNVCSEFCHKMVVFYYFTCVFLTYTLQYDMCISNLLKDG